MFGINHHLEIFEIKYSIAVINRLIQSQLKNRPSSARLSQVNPDNFAVAFFNGLDDFPLGTFRNIDHKKSPPDMDIIPLRGMKVKLLIAYGRIEGLKA